MIAADPMDDILQVVTDVRKKARQVQQNGVITIRDHEELSKLISGLDAFREYQTGGVL
jgi:hypothetical protein|nr:MAG TPA: hypothetical protein [Caudoviricetes sp.]